MPTRLDELGAGGVALGLQGIERRFEPLDEHRARDVRFTEEDPPVDFEVTW